MMDILAMLHIGTCWIDRDKCPNRCVGCSNIIWDTLFRSITWAWSHGCMNFGSPPVSGWRGRVCERRRTNSAPATTIFVKARSAAWTHETMSACLHFRILVFISGGHLNCDFHPDHYSRFSALRVFAFAAKETSCAPRVVTSVAGERWVRSSTSCASWLSILPRIRSFCFPWFWVLI